MNSKLINNNINDISELNLKHLIDNEVIERKTLDYKAGLPGNTDSAKKEFLADVSSFSNASGGDLILGITQDNTTGKPIGPLEGISISNLDNEIIRLDNIIRDGLEPNIPESLIKIKEVRLTNSNYIIIIRLTKSWVAPHRISYKAWDRFYTRSTNGKYRLDIQELRYAFLLSETLAENLKKFRQSRLLKIIAHETPFPLGETKMTILHLVPFYAFKPGQSYNLEEIYQLDFEPLFTTGYNKRYNIDGILFYFRRSEEPFTSTYLQVFRNGIIESAEDHLASEIPENFFPITLIEKKLIRKMKLYLKNLKLLKIEPPVFLFLSFIGYKGYRIIELDPLMLKDSIDRDVLLLPEVIIENYDEEASKILKFCFDALWNAFGYPKSENYNEEGEWAPRRS
ncbi:hypothetical protein LCGC14_0853990 [marine sediment metagenome]|uniref:Schlafen AlbA-2 domain-containing protein n=1 Tax=marine sediment metagenome TaxID=412755 RepID=A0A0F9P9G3_9ZZZZ